MRKKKQEKQINYLDLIPVKAEGLKWHKDFRNRVILEVKNEGFFNGIAQKVFNRPEVTKIHLDVHGSGSSGKRAVWRSGRTTLSTNRKIFSDS